MRDPSVPLLTILLTISMFGSAFAETDKSLLKALLLRDLGQYTEAVKLCDEFIASHPKSSEGYKTRGEIYLKWGAKPRALADLNKAIELDPGNGPAYSTRSLLHQEMGQLEQSRADNEKALEAGVEGPDAFLLQAKSLTFAGKGEEALRLLDEAAKKYPTNHHVYYNRGLVNGELGRPAKAIEDYTKAISLQPSFHYPYVNRGGEYFTLGRLDEALKDYTTAVRLNPRDSFAYLGRARVYLEKKDSKNALLEIETAVRLDPSPDMVYWRALIRGLNGDTGGASADAETILRTSKDPKLRQDAQNLLDAINAP